MFWLIYIKCGIHSIINCIWNVCTKPSKLWLCRYCSVSFTKILLAVLLLTSRLKISGSWPGPPTDSITFVCGLLRAVTAANKPERQFQLILVVVPNKLKGFVWIFYHKINLGLFSITCLVGLILFQIYPRFRF